MGAYNWESSEAATATAASGSEAGFVISPTAAEDASYGKCSMRRIPSVDDLFDPMWRLDVRASSGGGFDALALPGGKSRDLLGLGSKENAAGAYGFFDGIGDEDRVAEAVRFQESGRHLNGNWNESSSLNNDGFAGPTRFQSSPETATPIAGNSGGSQSRRSKTPEKTALSASASDEDQITTTTMHMQSMDDKKQKRMLSNRESARRSRLRKQQHLEDLRSQLADLRTQNSQILGKLTVATQQFTQINHDNQVLRLHAIELSRKLQRLHHKATAFHPSGLHAFGFGSSHLDPPGLALQSDTSSAYALVSQALEKSLCDTLLASP